MSIYPSSKVLPYVYKCVHKTTGKIYIGSRTNKNQKLPSHLDFPKYRTSSNYVKPIFDEFNWHIMAEFFDPLDAYDFEQQMIHEQWQVSKEMSLNRRCWFESKDRFNVINKESHRKGKILSKDTKDKMSKSHKNKFHTQETKDKMSKSRIGIPKTLEYLENRYSKSTKYDFITPDGFIIGDTTIKELCLQFNLKYKSAKVSFSSHNKYKKYIIIRRN